MTQLGESVAMGILAEKPDKALLVSIQEITFDSGIKLYNVAAGGAEVEVPPSGTPHWLPSHIHAAVYVREGGTGENKSVKLKVEWSQEGHDGAAKIVGTSDDGMVTIEASFQISGARGEAKVTGEFSKRPEKVANYGRGLVFEWQAEAGGTQVKVGGGSPLRLYFVDAKPKPVGWAAYDAYKAHYLKVVDWATRWTAGKAGEKDVRTALWAKFNDGKGACVPHATGYAYWKTDDPVQNMRELLQPDGDAFKRGWSCRAIAHLFMECLALHGIACQEVIPKTAKGTYAFLVKNWDVRAKPVPNWEKFTDLYYAGTWLATDSAPLTRAVTTSLVQQPLVGTSKKPLEIDMRKRLGVPAQGQPLAPNMFSNHWIVLSGGRLYDTSYGLEHPNDIDKYRTASISGWLVDTLADTTVASRGVWLVGGTSSAWCTHTESKYHLLRDDAAHN